MVTGKATLSLAHLVVSFAAVEALRDDPNNGCEGDYSPRRARMLIIYNLDGKPLTPNCSLDLNLNLYPWLDSLLIIAKN